MGYELKMSVSLELDRPGDPDFMKRLIKDLPHIVGLAEERMVLIAEQLGYTVESNNVVLKYLIEVGE